MDKLTKTATREILLGFWKAHILHHADEGPVVGDWILQELRRHGYDISPGTLYPLLARMEGNGWLRSEVAPGGIGGHLTYFDRPFGLRPAGSGRIMTAARSCRRACRRA